MVGSGGVADSDKQIGVLSFNYKLENPSHGPSAGSTLPAMRMKFQMAMNTNLATVKSLWYFLMPKDNQMFPKPC